MVLKKFYNTTFFGLDPLILGENQSHLQLIHYFIYLPNTRETSCTIGSTMKQIRLIGIPKFGGPTLTKKLKCLLPTHCYTNVKIVISDILCTHITNSSLKNDHVAYCCIATATPIDCWVTSIQILDFIFHGRISFSLNKLLSISPSNCRSRSYIIIVCWVQFISQTARTREIIALLEVSCLLYSPIINSAGLHFVRETLRFSNSYKKSQSCHQQYHWMKKTSMAYKLTTSAVRVVDRVTSKNLVQIYQRLNLI